MHIPDGYISPQTAGGLWAMMVPVWYAAGRKAGRALSARQAPLVAIGAAFAFVIMMFNIPLPGGTTAHAVGGTLVAIVIGPWAAVIAISVALIIQALFFGDGGILAIGANCFSMGFVLPVAGYYAYRLLARGGGTTRRWLAAGAGAYLGLNLAALFTGIILGIQGDFFKAADGSALYSPYGLSTAVPAMTLSHLLLIGPVEALMTSLVLIYLTRTHPALLREHHGSVAQPAGIRLKPLILGLLALMVLAPLGLLAAGAAWGEWSPAQIQKKVGYLPRGMQWLAGRWQGLLPRYSLPGRGGAGFWGSAPGYLLSAAAGVAAIAAAVLFLTLLLSRGRGAAEGAGGEVAGGAGGSLAEGAPWTLSGRRRRESVIQKTLMGMWRALAAAVFSERISTQPGLLQKTDARVKLAGLMGLLVAASLVRQWYLLLVIYGLTLAAASASRIPLSFFAKRVWLFIPLFAGVIAVPSLFNAVKGGDPILTILSFGHPVSLGPWSLGSSLAVTRQGLEGAALLVLRVAVSVSLAVLLTLTTRWSDLLKAMRVFYVPRAFILILSLTYRYAFLLLAMAADMYRARLSRMVGSSSPREDRRFAAASMGTLLGKSHALSEEVFAAMVSRGFTGEPVTARRFRLSRRDFAMAALMAALTAAAIGGNLLLG